MYVIKNEKICTRKCGMDGSMVRRDPIAFLFLERGRKSDVRPQIVRQQATEHS